MRRRYACLRLTASHGGFPTPFLNGSLGLMEDKDDDAPKAAFAASGCRSTLAVPVDAHSAPCYPVSILKPSFRVMVKRTPLGPPLWPGVCRFPAARTMAKRA